MFGNLKICYYYIFIINKIWKQLQQQKKLWKTKNL